MNTLDIETEQVTVITLPCHSSAYDIQTYNIARPHDVERSALSHPRCAHTVNRIV